MKVKVIITSSESNKEKGFDFPSLRAALEWAQNNGKTKLHLVKTIIKKP